MKGKSLYWDKMLIMRGEIGSEKEKDIIISQERPNFFAHNKKYQLYCTSEKSFDLKTLQEIGDFYSQNNELYTGAVIKISPKDIKKYLDVDSEIVYIERNRKILGCIVNVLFPTRINLDITIPDLLDKSERYHRLLPVKKDDKDIILPCTTFLNNHKKYRGKGLGMMLIQKSLQINYDIGNLSAYFLNSVPRCDNAIKINIWTYPCNFSRLEKLGIPYNRRFKNKYDRDLGADLKIILVDEKNSPEALFLYKSLVKDKSIYFNPDIKYWNKFIKSFRTYIVLSNGKNIGIFSSYHNNIYVTSNKCEITYGNRLICIGKQPETLECMLHQSRKNGYDIIHLQEVGDLTCDLLRKSYCTKTNNSDYLNFYNFRIVLSASDIYLPLL